MTQDVRRAGHGELAGGPPHEAGVGWLLGVGILALTASALLWISRRPRGSA